MGILFSRRFHGRISAAGNLALSRRWNGAGDGMTPLVRGCGCFFIADGDACVLEWLFWFVLYCGSAVS